MPIQPRLHRRRVLALVCSALLLAASAASSAAAAPDAANALSAAAASGASALSAAVSSAAATLNPAAVAGLRADAAHGGSAFALTTLSFPALHGAAGVKLTLGTLGCEDHGLLTVNYVDTQGDAQLAHQYIGQLGVCHLNKTLTRGSFSVRWSSALRVKLTLVATRRKVRRVPLSKGCDATVSTVRYAARGSMIAAIHAPQFGTIAKREVTLDLVRLVFPSCPSTGSTGASTISSSSGSISSSSGSSGSSSVAKLLAALFAGDELQAKWDPDSTLTATESKGTPSQVMIQMPEGDAPNPRIEALFSFTATGGGVFDQPSNLKTATIDLNTPVSTGTLDFTAGAGCPAKIRARDGSLSGSVTINDPVLGPLTLDGADLGTANLAARSAESFRCQGWNALF